MLIVNSTDIYHRSDPNEKKNRAPADEELCSLRALLNSNSHMEKFIDKELEQLQTSRKTLWATFVRQQQELEATQSQLYETDKVIDSLLEQKLAIEKRRKGLKSLTHPIRRLPVELLQAIFKSTVSTSQNKILAAVVLSSVCIRWREVALTTPQLWNTIRTIPFVDSGQFWACMIPRMKSLPLILHLKYPNEAEMACLENWHLVNILCKLTLEVDAPATISLALKTLFNEPYTILEDFCIAISNENEDDLVGSLEIAYQDLLGIFPNLTRFRIRSDDPLFFHPSPSSTLSTLILEEAREVDFYSLIRLFPSLKTLVLHYVQFVEPDLQTNIPRSGLKELELCDTPIFSSDWAQGMHFPGLISLYYNGDTTDMFKQFVVSHTTLEVLDCHSTIHDMTLFAESLPHLRSIFLSSSYEIVTNWKETNLKAPPFPSLQVLVIDSNCTLQQFEDIVRARCLPMDHPLSRLEQPSPTVELRIPIGEQGVENPLWSQHELALSADRKIFPYWNVEGVCFVALRWY